MIALQQAPATVDELTAYEHNIVAALKDGCYLAKLAGRLFLCDDRLPSYKRLIADDVVLFNLLAAGLRLDDEAGVWQLD